MHITRKKPIRTSLCFKGQSLLKYFPICKTLQYVSYFHHTVNFVSLLVYEKTSKQNSWFLLFQVSGWIIILLCWRRCSFLFGRIYSLGKFKWKNDETKRRPIQNAVLDEFSFSIPTWREQKPYKNSLLANFDVPCTSS